eukprot:1505362-Rhodomonas_salina.1
MPEAVAAAAVLTLLFRRERAPCQGERRQSTQPYSSSAGELCERGHVGSRDSSRGGITCAVVGRAKSDDQLQPLGCCVTAPGRRLCR